MVIVTWTSSPDNEWCTLDKVRLGGLRTVGVYLIWYAGDPGRVVAIGQGDIGEQLTAARCDASIQAYSDRGRLLVTWAMVSAARIDGIELFLADTWSPLIDCQRRGLKAIEVNSPGWMRAFV